MSAFSNSMTKTASVTPAKRIPRHYDQFKRAMGTVDSAVFQRTVDRVDEFAPLPRNPNNRAVAFVNRTLPEELNGIMDLN